MKLGKCFTFLNEYYGIEHGGNHGNQYTVASAKKMHLPNQEQPNTQSELADSYGISHQTMNNYMRLANTIPELEVMTTKQVATYYEVGIESIKNICRRHIDELKSDGMHLEKLDGFLKCQNGTPEKRPGKTVITYNNGIILNITNRGIRVFP